MIKTSGIMLITTLILMALSVILHEFGHMLAGLIFYHVGSHIVFLPNGLKGFTALSGILGSTYLNGDYGAIVPYAGGIFVALVIGLTWFVFRRKLCTEIKISMLLMLLTNGIYGLIEGLSVQFGFNVVNYISVIVLIGIPTVCSAVYMIRHSSQLYALRDWHKGKKHEALPETSNT